jgi:hypothetical protein
MTYQFVKVPEELSAKKFSARSSTKKVEVAPGDFAGTYLEDQEVAYVWASRIAANFAKNSAFLRNLDAAGDVLSELIEYIPTLQQNYDPFKQDWEAYVKSSFAQRVKTIVAKLRKTLLASSQPLSEDLLVANDPIQESFELGFSFEEVCDKLDAGSAWYLKTRLVDNWSFQQLAEARQLDHANQALREYQRALENAERVFFQLRKQNEI